MSDRYRLAVPGAPSVLDGRYYIAHREKRVVVVEQPRLGFSDPVSGMRYLQQRDPDNDWQHIAIVEAAQIDLQPREARPAHMGAHTSKIRALIQRGHGGNPSDTDVRILEILEVVVTAIEDLNASVQNLSDQVSAENTELGDVVSSLQSVSQQLTDLQNQVNSGGAVTSDQLEAVAASVKTVADSAAAATAAAQAATAPPADAPPADQPPADAPPADAGATPGDPNAPTT